MTPLYASPGSSSPPPGRLAVHSIIVSSAIVALVHAALGAAYLSGRSALEHWSETGLGKLLFVLPGPGIVASCFSVTLNSPHSTYVLFGILQFALAGLMLFLAFGMNRLWPSAFWAYWVLCCSAALNDAIFIARNTNLNAFHTLPGMRPYLLLTLVGALVAVTGAWLSRGLAVALSPPRNTATPQAAIAVLPNALSGKAISFLVLAGFLYCCLLPSTFGRIGGSYVRYEVVRFILMQAAFLGPILLLLFPATRRFSAPTAFGVGLLAFFTVGGTTFLSGEFFTGLILSFALGGLRHKELYVLLAFLLACLALVLATFPAMKRDSRSAAVAAIDMFWVLSINPFMHFLQFRDAQRNTLAHELAKGGPYLLYRAESCLLRYQAQHGPGFPASLQLVDTSLPGCLEPGMADGHELGGYVIEYRSSGPTPYAHFSLLAKPMMRGSDGSVRLFADETGILRTFSGQRPATANDYGVTPAEDFLSLQRCIANFTAMSDKNNRFGHDNNIGYDADQMRYPESFADMVAQPTCFNKDFRDGDNWKTAAYRYTYRRTAENGTENCVLIARPLQYGVTGLRSYFMDNTYIPHGTPRDREATVADDWAYRCEFFSFGTTCKDPRPFTTPSPSAGSPNEDSRITPEIARSIPVRLAPTGASELFWNSNQDFIHSLGIADDLETVYISLSRKGIYAVSIDGRNRWFLPGGKDSIVSGNSLYATTEDGILCRIDEKGTLLWAFSGFLNDSQLAFHNGVLYAYGAPGLWAISEKGELLWRMSLPRIGLGPLVLSADGQRLYLADNQRLHAVELKTRKRLWSIDNPCYNKGPACHPSELANGSIALIKFERRSAQDVVVLRIIDPKGNVLHSFEYPPERYWFEYVVPHGTNTIVVGFDGHAEARNLRGELEWSTPDGWRDLYLSRRPGIFYASLRGVELLVEANGHVAYQVPGKDINHSPFGRVYELGDDLAFIESQSHSIWLTRLPPASPKTNLSLSR